MVTATMDWGREMFTLRKRKKVLFELCKTVYAAATTTWQVPARSRW